MAGRDVVVSVSARWVAHAHTALAFAGFFGALIVGMSLHYVKIVQNEHFGYPVEWFPSVSATIGDWYPERSVFQIFIAITSGPRFAICGLWYLLTRHRGGNLPLLVMSAGLLRTITCGGWVYVTSTDDHDWHDIFMISYLVLTIPWQLGCLKISASSSPGLRLRKLFSGLFFGTIIPLVFFFIQHKVHQKPGAYTIYAFFEWSLIIYDVAFDASAAADFDAFEIQIRANEPDSAKKHGFAPVAAFDLGRFLHFVASTVYALLSWSTFTALPLLVWYFPLWNMGISGYEAMLLVLLAPVLLLVPIIRKLATRYINVVRAIHLIGLLGYKVHEPASRLITIGVANAAGAIYWAVLFTSNRSRPIELDHDICAFVLGLILSSIAKLSHYANNPFWPIMHAENGGENVLGIVLGVASAVYLAVAKPQSVPSTGRSPAQPRASLVGLGFGGLMFGLHSMLSDSSTIILWVWDGFPLKGPIVVPHGGFVILFMLAGLWLGFSETTWSRPHRSLASVAVGLTLLYWFDEYPGYFGGLLFTVGICALAPALLRASAQTNPGACFGIGFLTYIVVALMHVWVVAYAFVPGGPLLRERSDLVLITTTALLGAGVLGLREASSTEKATAQHVKSTVLSSLRYAAAVSAVATAVICYLRFPTFDYTPYHAEEKLFTAGIWTIHFGLDNDMWASETRMRDIIRELELDVVGLLESDTQRLIMGQRDLTQQIAEEIGMYVDFGPGPNKHTWGAALLSKFPIIQSTHHLLPSPVGELAPAIHATLDMYGKHIDVIVSHNGQEEDPEDRRLQSTELGRIMRESQNPFVFLGYVVSVPGEYPQRHLTEDTRMHDIEPTDWDRWCEYILYRGVKRVGYARVHRSTITDTEIQTGKFVVLDEPATAPSYERVSEDDVPPGYRYPAQFRGDGVRGHRYNNNEVVKEPWYYA